MDIKRYIDRLNDLTDTNIDDLTELSKIVLLRKDSANIKQMYDCTKEQEYNVITISENNIELINSPSLLAYLLAAHNKFNMTKISLPKPVNTLVRKVQIGLVSYEVDTIKEIANAVGNHVDFKQFLLLINFKKIHEMYKINSEDIIYLITNLKHGNNDIKYADTCPVLPTEAQKAILSKPELIKSHLVPDDTLDIEMQEAIVLKDSQYIKAFPNVSDKCKMRVIDKSADYIQFMNDPNEELQMNAIKRGASLAVFPNIPTYAVQLKAIALNPLEISFIHNPSYELQLSAISRKTDAIKYIENPYPELVDSAVEVNPQLLIHYSYTISPALQTRVLKRDPALYRYIDSPDPEAVLNAIRMNPSVIRFVTQPTTEMLQLAIDKNPHLLVEDVLKDKLTTDLILQGINKMPSLLWSFNDDLDVQEFIIKNKPEYIHAINSKLYPQLTLKCNIAEQVYRKDSKKLNLPGNVKSLLVENNGMITIDFSSITDKCLSLFALEINKYDK